MTKKIILSGAVTLLLFVLFPFQKIHSENSNDSFLTVSVYEEDGAAALSNAEVNIFSMDDILLQSGITGSNGKIYFSLKNLPVGKYKVKAYYFINAKEIRNSVTEINYTGENIEAVLKIENR
ncbi:MAG: carboxypeptidase regulatory-like domain-containing protein [Ignavibacteria bacterium]|nr:carboxypeptidase regulatory-like domain-containing protein [Ignavibacteria bacterium]